MNNLTGMRILVINDDYLIARELAESLSDSGCEVVGPYPSMELPEFTSKADTIDAVVIGLTASYAGIVPVAHAARNQKLPIVFTSGYDKNPFPEQYATYPWIQYPMEHDAVSMALKRQF